VVATIPVGSHPISATYDSANGYVYVVNQYSDNVSVINGTSVVGTFRAGFGPVVAVYDSENGYVYVGELGCEGCGSAIVGIVRGTSVIANVSVGVQAEYVAYDEVYDSGNGYVYVFNSGSTNVTVLNGTSVLGTIPLPSSGFSAGTYDSASGYVYLGTSGPDYGGGTGIVGVISGTSYLTTLPVDIPVTSLVYDPGNGDVYAVNSNSTEVIRGLAVSTSVSIDPGYTGLSYATYDSHDGDLYVPGPGPIVNYPPPKLPEQFPGNVSVINGTSVVTKLRVGNDPTFAVYDSRTQEVYVTDLASHAVWVINGTSLVAMVPVGLGPLFATSDPGNGYV